MSTPAVCSALYILDSNFKNLLSRDWRGDTTPQHVERFASKMQDVESESEQRPIIEDEDAKVTYVYIQHNNLYLLAMTRNNANAVALLTFLHHLVEIFIHYFKVRASPLLHSPPIGTRPFRTAFTHPPLPSSVHPVFSRLPIQPVVFLPLPLSLFRIVT